MILLLALAAQAVAPPDVARPRDWAATTRADAEAFHARILADHPGPVNRADPGFRAREAKAYATLLARAAKVRDFAGYHWAMRGYVASFDDGHVQFGTLKGSPLLTARWPGFLTGLDPRGKQVVMTRADDAPVPLGAELVACDGLAADPLLARNVGAFAGRWTMLATRRSRAGRLFVDTGNPFITRPATCRFTVQGKPQTVTLTWGPLADPEWTQRLADTTRAAPIQTGARVLADGTRWFSIASFDSNPEGPVAKALNPMIAGMRADRAALLAAPRIVFDLRGNGGGSSQWSHDMATILWGEAAVAKVDAVPTYVEWRASANNVATMRGYVTQWEASKDVSPDALAWARRNADGLAAAQAKGQALWRGDDGSDDAPKTAPAPVTGPTRPVYVLTDGSCASACLDAVDLWTALGAIPIGQETSGDTLYMEVGGGPLPSGLASVGVPMKVYRGRARGSNQPVRPRHPYTGDMRDTAALERWVAALPEGEARRWPID
ncbi:S41 family peptidase [Sphingomonas floccifaciens]|uniref:S41 family peptidase n=1 Tax=Sphingomonas floccifaciens TaxID=1844115 RepID=A0ABW4NA12_9SPHN